MTTWSAEDEKLVTLAKGARSRVSANSGAALRDTTGRTYSSAEVKTEFLQLSAIELVIGQAIASGATGVEAIVICTENPSNQNELELIKKFSSDAQIYLINLQGERLDA
jgi:cytidine deaminase